jgi:hypothetical protein
MGHAAGSDPYQNQQRLNNAEFVCGRTKRTKIDTFCVRLGREMTLYKPKPEIETYLHT